MENKTLYRSADNRILYGVCGGFADYFGVDPALVRLIWVFSIFVGGAGVWAYIVAILIIPENPKNKWEERKMNEKTKVEEEAPRHPEKRKQQSRFPFLGIGLVVLGAVFLINNFLPSFGFDKFWPIIPIGIGLILLFPQSRR